MYCSSNFVDIKTCDIVTNENFIFYELQEVGHHFRNSAAIFYITLTYTRQSRYLGRNAACRLNKFAECIDNFIVSHLNRANLNDFRASAQSRSFKVETHIIFDFFFHKLPHISIN